MSADFLAELFVPTLPLIEILVRGSVTYLSLFLIMRVVLKREAGAVGIADLLVVVLIADAAQNALSGSYTSITDGVLLVAVIIFWSYTLDWLGHYVPPLSRLLRPPPLLLVENGRILRRNLRKELITEEEVFAEIREAGLEDVSQVKKMFMEGDGEFSVIPLDGNAGVNKKSKNLF